MQTILAAILAVVFSFFAPVDTGTGERPLVSGYDRQDSISVFPSARHIRLTSSTPELKYHRIWGSRFVVYAGRWYWDLNEPAHSHAYIDEVMPDYKPSVEININPSKPVNWIFAGLSIQPEQYRHDTVKVYGIHAGFRLGFEPGFTMEAVADLLNTGRYTARIGYNF